jgi:putative ABC transport system ATP-binding protein
MLVNGDKHNRRSFAETSSKRGSGNAEVHARCELDVYPGEITMLVGPSGCGKRRCCRSSRNPSADERNVIALGSELTKLNSWRGRLSTAKRRLRVPAVQFIAALTAAENASVPLVIQGYSKRRQWPIERAAHKNGHGRPITQPPRKALRRQQQRVAIARALVHHPLAGLRRADFGPRRKTGHTILELLRSIAIEGDRAVIIVTHDSRIFEFADTLARMDDGQIVSIERQAKGGRALIA